MAGAPKGNNNAGKGRMATHALEMAVENGGKAVQVASGIQVLVDIWNVQVEKALEGDQQAANAIMDRLDGKPAQTVALDADLRVKEVKDLSDDELASIAAGSS